MNSCETTVYLLMCTASFFLSPGHLWASTWQVCAQAEQRAEVSQTASRLPQRLCFGWHWTEEGNQVTGIDTERLGWLFKVLLLQRLQYQLLWPYLLLHTYMQYTVVQLIVVFMYIQNHRLMLGNVEKRRECLKQHSKAKGMHQLHGRRKCSLVHACAYTVKPL